MIAGDPPPPRSGRRSACAPCVDTRPRRPSTSAETSTVRDRTTWVTTVQSKAIAHVEAHVGLAGAGCHKYFASNDSVHEEMVGGFNHDRSIHAHARWSQRRYRQIARRW